MNSTFNLTDSIITGYLHPSYADSLAEFGKPRELKHCGGWILERQVPGTPHRDAMGCYPLFLCQNWSQLHLDLEELGGDLLSLALVTDPFGSYDPVYLEQCFDKVTPFKNHFVIDCSQPMEKSVSKNHRYQARKALKKIQVEKCQQPLQYLQDWLALYATLTQKYGLKGIHAFSKESFNKQLRIPGMVMFRAVHQDVTVGAILLFEQGEFGYAHLVASSDLGYKMGVSYALFWRAIEHFHQRVHWLTIGATSGLTKTNNNGLDFFKQGWATETRTTYFCGRVFDQHKYIEIVKAKNILDTDYFPAYRQGEFT